jgi:hypothetical protein
MSQGENVLNQALVAGLDRIREATTRPLPGPDSEKKRPQPVQDAATIGLSAEQLARYLACGGVQCPSCGSTDISGSQFDVIEGACWQNITCQECGAEWTDEYELTTVTDFVPGVKSTNGGQTIDT